MIEFVDKTSEQSGTPLDRAHFMAMQGFEKKTTVFNPDGSITETNADDHVTTIVFDKANNKIIETFVGEKTISKTTYFEGNIIREETGV